MHIRACDFAYLCQHRKWPTPGHSESSLSFRKPPCVSWCSACARGHHMPLPAPPTPRDINPPVAFVKTTLGVTYAFCLGVVRSRDLKRRRYGWAVRALLFSSPAACPARPCLRGRGPARRVVLLADHRNARGAISVYVNTQPALTFVSGVISVTPVKKLPLLQPTALQVAVLRLISSLLLWIYSYFWWRGMSALCLSFLRYHSLHKNTRRSAVA